MAAQATGAPDFPTKPIRIVIAGTAGSVPDVVARLIGNRLTDARGRPIVVAARPGATGGLLDAPGSSGQIT